MVGLPIHGRGAAENPAGRYERLDYEPDPDYEDPDDPEPRPATHFYRDTTRKIIASSSSEPFPCNTRSIGKPNTSAAA